MRLVIKTSGGIGNIQLQGQLDTADMSDELAHRVNAVINPSRLDVESSKHTPLVADAVQYDLDVEFEDGRKQFTISDEAASSEVLEVIEELVRQMVQKKLAAG